MELQNSINTLDLAALSELAEPEKIKEMEYYREKVFRDDISALLETMDKDESLRWKEDWDRGWRIGWERGWRIGFEKGYKKGIRKVAARLRSAGFSEEDIRKYTE